MLFKRLFFSLFLAGLAGGLVISPARAFPPLPSSFYGQVKVNGQAVPDGSLVRAWIGGTAYAEARTQTYQGGSVYQLNVPGDDLSTAAIEGGREGDSIQFEVGGVLATPGGIWHSGVNQNVDLSAASATPLATPQPTAQPTQAATPTRTAAAATKAPATAVPPTLPAPTAVPSSTLPPGLAPTALSTSTGQPVPQPTQAGSLPSQPPGPSVEPTRTSAAGTLLPVSPTARPGSGAAPLDALTPLLVVVAVVGAALLGGAAWLMPRLRK